MRNKKQKVRGTKRERMRLDYTRLDCFLDAEA